MKTLQLELGSRSYPIYLGEGILHNTELLRRHVRGQQVMIVSNSVVAKHYLELIKKAFTDRQCDVVLIPDGEAYKTLETLNTIFDALLKQQHHRNTTLIALGGGVVGDMTGFAAACYQRGVDFLQIPTTLLAQVDASVGGKTAVNHPLGKNMIGAFHQPRCVLIDTTTLATLSEREFRAGVAEIIKAALIQDSEFFTWLESNMPKLLEKNSSVLIEAIARACQIKIQIVSEDEKETNKRAWLNLGHTFGHALEQLSHYDGTLLHGEAVSIGMVLAADLSLRFGWLKAQDVERIRNILIAARLPVLFPNEVSYPQFLEVMLLDKKVNDKGLCFVLLKGIGQATLTASVTEEQLRTIMENNSVR